MATGTAIFVFELYGIVGEGALVGIEDAICILAREPGKPVQRPIDANCRLAGKIPRSIRDRILDVKVEIGNVVFSDSPVPAAAPGFWRLAVGLPSIVDERVVHWFVAHTFCAFRDSFSSGNYSNASRVRSARSRVLFALCHRVDTRSGYHEEHARQTAPCKR